MSPDSLLADLKAQGVTVWHSEGQIRCRGPDETVNAALPKLRAHRDALLALLKPRLDSDGLPVGPCPVCGSQYFWMDHEDYWTCGRCQEPEAPQLTCVIPPAGFRVISEPRSEEVSAIESSAQERPNTTCVR